jgi:hypothetical protein
MWRAAFKEDVGFETRDTAGRIKRRTNEEGGVEKKQRMRSKLPNVHASGMAKFKSRIANRKKVKRQQWQRLEWMTVGVNGFQETDTDVNLAAFQQCRQRGANRLGQLDLHVRTAFRIAQQKICKDAVDCLRRGADLKDADVASPHPLSSLGQGPHCTENDAGIIEELLPFSGQRKSAANAIE